MKSIRDQILDKLHEMLMDAWQSTTPPTREEVEIIELDLARLYREDR